MFRVIFESPVGAVGNDGNTSINTNLETEDLNTAKESLPDENDADVDYLATKFADPAVTKAEVVVNEGALDGYKLAVERW